MEKTQLFIVVGAIVVFVGGWFIRRFYFRPANPYPNRPGFTAVWDSLTPSQCHTLKKNIKIIEVDHRLPLMVYIKPLNRTFYLLAPRDGANDKDVFVKEDESGRYVRYFTLTAALRELEKNDASPITAFEQAWLVSYLPGKYKGEKLRNLFGLMEWGFFGQFSTATRKHEESASGCSSVCLLMKMYAKYYITYNGRLGTADYEYVAPGTDQDIALPMLVWKKGKMTKRI